MSPVVKVENLSCALPDSTLLLDDISLTAYLHLAHPSDRWLEVGDESVETLRKRCLPRS